MFTYLNSSPSESVQLRDRWSNDRKERVVQYLTWFTKIIFTHFLVVEESFKPSNLQTTPSKYSHCSRRSITLTSFSRDLLIGCWIAQFEFAVTKSLVRHIRACWFISVSMSFWHTRIGEYLRFFQIAMFVPANLLISFKNSDDD